LGLQRKSGESPMIARLLMCPSLTTSDHDLPLLHAHLMPTNAQLMPKTCAIRWASRCVLSAKSNCSPIQKSSLQTNGLSKKFEFHAHALSLNFISPDFIRVCAFRTSMVTIQSTLLRWPKGWQTMYGTLGKLQSCSIRAVFLRQLWDYTEHWKRVLTTFV